MGARKRSWGCKGPPGEATELWPEGLAIPPPPAPGSHSTSRHLLPAPFTTQIPTETGEAVVVTLCQAQHHPRRPATARQSRARASLGPVHARSSFPVSPTCVEQQGRGAPRGLPGPPSTAGTAGLRPSTGAYGIATRIPEFGIFLDFRASDRERPRPAASEPTWGPGRRVGGAGLRPLFLARVVGSRRGVSGDR